MSRIGIIGGSGLYKIEGFKNIKQQSVNTPFGEPSDKFTLGNLAGKEAVFLPRHAIGHRISPTEINYRANIWAMKKLGVDRIISITACGSLKEDLRPLDFVLPDQFVDRTNQARKMTFFSDGIVAHISFAHPVCDQFRALIFRAINSLGLNVHNGGTYLNMEGPAFSTKAESELYRSWDMDIIGMTNMAEARLAREAEICFVTLAAVTDYDCWHESETPVTVEMIIANLNKNIDNAKKILTKVIPEISEERTCECKGALKNAIITGESFIPKKTKKNLSLLISKYIK
ncbi:MAG: S-methyl-5'-thioadenosine phosphorylase [Candidatus Omnitrophota bacterium]